MSQTAGGASFEMPGLPELLARLVRRGVVYDLSHELSAEMPLHPLHPPFAFTLMQRHGDIYRQHEYSFANELIVMSGHHGTHIDAVGHISQHNELHGGVSAFEAQRGRGGLTQHGVQELPPLICRGVLLDLSRFRDVDELPHASPITAEELERTAASQGVELLPGDAVLIRTGWARRWQSRESFLAAQDGTPGPDHRAAVWLAERGMRLTGSDTLVYEVLRPDQNEMPVHLALLYERAIPIMEMLQLEHLAAAGIWEFLFIALPLKIRGATGSPVRAIALV